MSTFHVWFWRIGGMLAILLKEDGMATGVACWVYAEVLEWRQKSEASR